VINTWGVTIPKGLMRKRELAEKVVKKVGDPITIVMNEGKINPTPYLHARVWLDLKKPLVRVVPITLKERMKYLVQYEKLPAFCFFCGCMGHEVTECGDGIHSRETCEWGDWLRVQFMPTVPGRDDTRGGRGRGHGRGGGRGDGAEDAYEDMETYQRDDENSADSQGTGRVAMQVTLLEHQDQKEAAISPLQEQEKKRPRRSEGGNDSNATKNIIRSALSFEESDRAQ